MDKSDYINRMTEVLNDTSTYKKLKKDPIKQVTSKLNQLVKSWLDNDIIEYHDYKRLNCTNGNLPRGYGLPKVHKAGFPMRIIVSAIGSPLYNVASFMHDILQKSIPKPRSRIKDSWSFVRKIANVNIDTDEILISLDVTALFTNIPKELVCEGIRKQWHYISQHTNLNLTQFLHAIELILQSTSFGFDGQFYEQIFGSPMGSPLSPSAILADIVMDDLETHCISLLNFEIRVFLRYVDDIFAIVPKNSINVLLEVFNNYHPRLQFTFETEVDNSIPFLDTLVIRDGDRKDISSSDDGCQDSTFDARNYIVIPYIKGISEGIRRTLKNVGLDALYSIPKKLNTVIKRGQTKRHLWRLESRSIVMTLRSIAAITLL
ncbi:uncharacterized protein [Temnothorax nylanderi]|uniref:uncharacterized protein n=1 Tax=Temnothorax nylanderi TaxID=102681 RepID=UPI003A86B750